MAVFDVNASEALQFAGVASITYLVTWWIIRPLSFVYRLNRGSLSVRTFFLLQVATVKLSEISQVEVSRPSDGKPVRWLVSPYRRWSGQTIFAETKQAWVVLPDRFAGVLAAHTPADDPPSQFRGDGRYQHVLAAVMASNLGVRKLAGWCVPLAGAAAWCIILLPLWLTWMEVTGAKMCAANHHIAVSALLGRESWAHFAASAFLIACGIAVRGLLAFGLPLPWPLAGISLFAAFSRLSLQFPASHDVLSHTLFDSCTGYDERHAMISITCLVAAIILALAAWSPSRKRVQPVEDEAAGFAATP